MDTARSAPSRGAPMIAGLVVWVAIAFLPGVVGSLFQPGEWYARLAKPPWTPPGWVFGPVWTALYLLMGVAAWLVWRERGLRGAPWTFGLFFTQLVLNGAWSWLFFGLQRPGLALVDIALLWLVLLGTAICFGRVRPAAGWLLAPYLLWVTFAAALNLEIWRLN